MRVNLAYTIDQRLPWVFRMPVVACQGLGMDVSGTLFAPYKAYAQASQIGGDNGAENLRGENRQG